ncbi:hypothetical protein [Acidithiobacillus ferrivorans]|nr:hypothetical protein [Acidithiobacillus ferrivorans]
MLIIFYVALDDVCVSVVESILCWAIFFDGEFMGLTELQVKNFGNAINAYAFPATYYDFVQNVPIRAAGMAGVESAIGNMLLSANPETAKQGLANILYWGYAQIGFGPTRVDRFWNGVTTDQIHKYQTLVTTRSLPTLRQLRDVGMPEYSGISFLSKILMFLNQTEYCVLDLQLAKLSPSSSFRALHKLKFTTTIGVTEHNKNIYNQWREECMAISKAYFNGSYRVVDIERGFFYLIQSAKVSEAQEIYASA